MLSYDYMILYLYIYRILYFNTVYRISYLIYSTELMMMLKYIDDISQSY